VAAFTAALLLASSTTAISAIARDSQTNAYGSYLAARIAASEHDMAEAAKLYTDSLASDPDNADLISRAFLYTAASGDIDGAKGFAQRVVATDKENRTARLALAVIALRHHDFREARSQISQSGKGPFMALTLSLLDAWAAEGAGDVAAALKDLQDVASEGGTAALAAYHKALILDLADRRDEADAAYKDALTQSPNNPRLVESYGRFLERNGRAADAKALYAQHAADTGMSPILDAANARIASGHGTPDRLIGTPEAGAAEALFGVAASLTDATSADVAILYLRLTLYLSPDFDLAKIVLADRFEALKKYQDAIEVYRSISRDSPYRFAGQIQTAVDETRLGDKDKALGDLKSLVADQPSDLTAWTALGDAYREVEKFPEAADAYDHAVKLLGTVTSKDWPLFFARGVAEERAHQWTAAEADLKQALKLSPDQPEVLNYLGYSWIDQGHNYPAALSMLEKARGLSPFDGYIVDSVGWAYFRVGRYNDAAKTLQQAVLLVPGDPTINEHLGDAYWMVGRKLDAQFQWNHAIAFGADDKQKAEIEKKLQSGLTPADARRGG
jgi:tetratricopeptide (TPR) repeat protein